VKGRGAVANVEDLGLLPVAHHALASRRGIDKVERLDPRLEKVRARASRQVNGMNHLKKTRISLHALTLSGSSSNASLIEMLYSSGRG
jgi:hypothetical protein